MSRLADVVSLINIALSSPPVIAGISPVPLPMDASFPYITCQEVTGRELGSLEGRSNMLASVIQVNCWDIDYESASAIRESVKDLLIDYSVGSIKSVIHSLDSELYDGARKIHQLITRFQVWWEV